MPIYNGMLPAIDKAEVKRYAGLRHAEAALFTAARETPKVWARHSPETKEP